MQSSTMVALSLDLNTENLKLIESSEFTTKMTRSINLVPRAAHPEKTYKLCVLIGHGCNVPRFYYYYYYKGVICVRVGDLIRRRKLRY